MAERQEINKEKLKALQLTMDKIDKSYGKGTIMRMGENAVVDIPVISEPIVTQTTYERRKTA